MTAASSTASDTEPTGPPGPIRTCVGCRERAAATELLRVVVAADASSGPCPAIVPDPQRRLPGRGAWVHPVQECVDLAQRRRAFARALRVPGEIDPVTVVEYVSHARLGTTKTSGTPQEMKS